MVELMLVITVAYGRMVGSSLDMRCALFSLAPCRLALLYPVSSQFSDTSVGPR